MVSINPMSRTRELSYLLKDSGATVLVSPGGALRRGGAGRRARHRRAARCSPPASWSSRPATTSGCSPASSRQRHEGTTDFLEFIDEHRGQAPPPVELAADDVAFLTYTSGTTGVPKGAMNTHRNVVVHRAGLPRLGARRAGRRDLRHRPAVPHHRADRAHRGEHAGARTADPGLPVRAAGGARRASSSTGRRSPSAPSRRSTPCCNAPAFTQGPLRLVHVRLLRRRGDLPDRREGVPGGDGHPGAQRLRPDRDHVADDA